MVRRRIASLALALSLFVVSCSAPAPSSIPTSSIPPSAAPASPAVATGSQVAVATIQPSSPPGVANADRPLTVDELKDVLIAVQATGDSATVVADVSLTPVHEACEAPSPCPFGIISLPGLDPAIVTAEEDVRALYPNATAPVTGPLALQLGADVALLGVETLPGGALVTPVGSASIPTPDQAHVGWVFAVSGGLAQSINECPVPSAAPAPLPSDSPFDPCDFSSIMSPSGGSTGAIRVQPSAFATFAGPVAGGPETTSPGVYLIREVKDPRATCTTDCYGWLMVGRLDPIQ